MPASKGGPLAWCRRPVCNEFWRMCLPSPQTDGTNGTFSGIMVCVFNDEAGMQTVLAKLKESPNNCASENVWASPDRPLEERAVPS